MSDLIIYDSNNLPSEVKEVLTALSSEFVKDMTDAELYDYLKPLIAKSFTDSGHNQPQNTTYFISEVLNDVRQVCKWQALRKSELSIAFYKGIRKEYGDYVGLPVVRFTEFLNGYIKSQYRAQALAERHKPLDAVSEPSDDEKFILGKSNALKAYQDVKEGNDINLYGSVVYDFLNGLNIVQMDNADKWSLIDEASNQILREKEVKSTVILDQIKASAIRKEIDQIRSGAITPIVVKRAKCLCLLSWMQGLIMDDGDLEFMIDVAKP